MTILAVGSPYPFPLREGATAAFLTKSGCTLQISIPDMSDEKFALKKGKIKGGFLYKNGSMIWLFQFYDKKQLVLTLDSPFDVRRIPKDLLQLHDITNQRQRLVIDIHVVDNGIIKTLRAVTMSHKLTIEFLTAVQDQIVCTDMSTPDLMAWMQLPVDQLASMAKMTELGK